jgi:hypothetical protein
MKQSFEDNRRKPVKISVITMAEFLKKQVERVILAKRNKRVFQHA